VENARQREAGAGGFARDRVLAAVRTAIAGRTLLPGQQVAEVELAASLGVSRTPVREALRELEQQGLVVSYPFRGSFIRTFSAKDVENLVFLRAALEGMAASQAVENASRAQMRRLDELVGEMAAVLASEAGETAATVIDLTFHDTLVALSGNGEIARVWRWVDPLIRTMLAHDAPQRAPEDARARHERLVSRHRLLVDALLSGDAHQAEQAVRAHIVEPWTGVVVAMRRAEEGSVRPDGLRELSLFRPRLAGG
jgi:DNA-binding GntR family transcriptional regulator